MGSLDEDDDVNSHRQRRAAAVSVGGSRVKNGRSIL